MRFVGASAFGTIVVLAAFLPFPAASDAAGKYPASAFLASRHLTEADFPRWQQLERNVYVYQDTEKPDASGAQIATNCLIVVTKDGVVLADGQGDDQDGKRLVETIRKLTPQPLKYVVVGSDHPDHTGGNAQLKAAFPDAVWIASPASRDKMLKSAVVPSELVTDRKVLNLGGTEIEVLNLGRAHTGGDLAVYLPQSKVLFLSEIYMRDLFPAMRTAYPSEWVQTIRKAEAIDAKWDVPAHGFIDSRAELKAGLDDARKATEYVIAEATRLHDAGVPCASRQNCEALGKADWGPYTQWAQEEPGQVPLAILRVYQEIEGRLP